MLDIADAKRFILAGNAYFTIENGKAGDEYQRFTFRVSKPDDNAASSVLDYYFVSVLTGPDNTKNYTYMGMLDGRHEQWQPNGGTFRETKGSKIRHDALSWKVFDWLMKYVYASHPLPNGYRLYHSGRCGRCGRQLTVPESIKAGIGPECRKAMGLTPLEGAN